MLNFVLSLKETEANIKWDADQVLAAIIQKIQIQTPISRQRMAKLPSRQRMAKLPSRHPSTKSQK